VTEAPAFVPPAAPEEPAEEPVVKARLDALVRKCRTDGVLATQMLPFIEHATWAHDGDGTVTGTLATVNPNGQPNPVRVIELTKTLIIFGLRDFPERKRIPFA
jgi:hypothetical protein